MTATHLLVLAGYTVTAAATDGRLRITHSTGTGANLDLAVGGPYFLRGDGAADDLAEVIRDGYVAIGGTGADGDVTAGVTHSLRASEPTSALYLTDGTTTWAPDHANASSNLPAAVTGWPATAPAEAATITATLSSELVWNGAPSPGAYLPARPSQGRQVQARSGRVQAAERGPVRPQARLSWPLVRGGRAWVHLNTADPQGTWERFLDRNRWGVDLEAWLVELDANGRHDFTDGGLARQLLGTYVVAERSAESGEPPADAGTRVAHASIQVALVGAG